VAVLALSIVLMGAGFPAKHVPPKQWAKSVCSSVSTWVNDARTGATGLDQAATAGSPSIPKIKAALVHYLSNTADSTGAVLDRLHHAGTPKTPKGKQAAAGLITGFEKIQHAAKGFVHDAKAVSTSNQTAALADLKSLQTRINNQFGSLNASFGNLGRLDPGHKIAKAFKATRACRALKG
jgi:hypothetical protein